MTERITSIQPPGLVKMRVMHHQERHHGHQAPQTYHDASACQCLHGKLVMRAKSGIACWGACRPPQAAAAEPGGVRGRVLAGAPGRADRADRAQPEALPQRLRPAPPVRWALPQGLSVSGSVLLGAVLSGPGMRTAS